MVISRRWQTEAGLASGRESALMPGALDPIDAAKNDIAGSKDLIASAATISASTTAGSRAIAAPRSSTSAGSSARR